MLKSFWAGHGTKLVGSLVALLGLLGALNAEQLQVLFGAKGGPFVAVLVGGLLTLLRGFQGPKQNPLPPPSADFVATSKDRGFIDRDFLCGLAVLALVVLGACSLLTQAPLDGKIGAAKETVAAIESAAATAVEAHSLDPDIGTHIYQMGHEQVVPFLDSAHAAIVAGNPTEAQAQYNLAFQVLEALQAYVNAHQPGSK